MGDHSNGLISAVGSLVFTELSKPTPNSISKKWISIR